MLADPVSDFDGEDSESDTPRSILFVASFDELASQNVQYDTVIWVSLSCLLILAWGVGILMLLYLPMRRYILQKDIASRKLYVTPHEIVYKVSRPSFIPFWGETKLEKHVPLHLVIDVIMEQGCLQAVFGIKTLRIESKARGRVASVDELQVHGVHNPGNLRRVIVSEASKAIQEGGRSWKRAVHNIENESASHVGSLVEGHRRWRMIGSPQDSSMDNRGVVHMEMMQKLEEVTKSVKKIELLLEKKTDAGHESD